MSASGPLYGTAAALAAVVAGLALTAAGVGGVIVEPSAFQDSLLVGILGVYVCVWLGEGGWVCCVCGCVWVCGCM